MGDPPAWPAPAWWRGSKDWAAAVFLAVEAARDPTRTVADSPYQVWSHHHAAWVDAFLLASRILHHNR